MGHSVPQREALRSDHIQPRRGNKRSYTARERELPVIELLNTLRITQMDKNFKRAEEIRLKYAQTIILTKYSTGLLQASMNHANSRYRTVHFPIGRSYLSRCARLQTRPPPRQLCNTIVHLWSVWVLLCSLRSRSFLSSSPLASKSMLFYQKIKSRAV